MMLGFILMTQNFDHNFLGGGKWWFKEIFFCPLYLQFMQCSFNFLFNDRLSVHLMYAPTSVQLELAGLFQCSFPGFGQCYSKLFLVTKWSLTDEF